MLSYNGTLTATLKRMMFIRRCWKLSLMCKECKKKTSMFKYPHGHVPSYCLHLVIWKLWTGCIILIFCKLTLFVSLGSKNKIEGKTRTVQKSNGKIVERGKNIST